MAAKQVGRVEEIVLRNDDVVEIRPLNLKRLRRFMRAYREMMAWGRENLPKDVSETDNYEETMTNKFITLGALCLTDKYPKETAFVDKADELPSDEFEELIDQDILSFIIEVSSGIKMSLIDDGAGGVDVEDLTKTEASE